MIKEEVRYRSHSEGLVVIRQSDEKLLGDFRPDGWMVITANGEHNHYHAKGCKTTASITDWHNFKFAIAKNYSITLNDRELPQFMFGKLIELVVGTNLLDEQYLAQTKILKAEEVIVNIQGTLDKWLKDNNWGNSALVTRIGTDMAKYAADAIILAKLKFFNYACQSIRLAWFAEKQYYQEARGRKLGRMESDWTASTWYPVMVQLNQLHENHLLEKGKTNGTEPTETVKSQGNPGRSQENYP